MSPAPRNLIVVGQGAAGLSAALAATLEARRRGAPVQVTLVDKASAGEAGGNTRWIAILYAHGFARPGRAEFRARHAGGHEISRRRELLRDAGPRKRRRRCKWIAAQGIEFIQPTYYLAKGPPRIQPVGGGPAIVAKLTQAAQAAGVVFRHGCAAQTLASDNGRVSGLVIARGRRARGNCPPTRSFFAAAAFKATARPCARISGRAPRPCG